MPKQLSSPSPLSDNTRNHPFPKHFGPITGSYEASSRVQFWSMVARSAQYSVQNLAKRPDISLRQLERYCRKELGRSPQDWLNEQRIIAARLLLLETESVKRVALELGFKQVSHFCRQFKQFYGVTPSEFLLHQAKLNRICRSQITSVAHR